jgi:hypothetical protein
MLFNFFNKFFNKNKKEDNKLNDPWAAYRRAYIYLYRGRKSTFESKNKVMGKYQIAVEFPDDFTYDFDNPKELLGKKFKYKMGDGKTPYKDLPYEDGEIPVAFIQYH